MSKEFKYIKHSLFVLVLLFCISGCKKENPNISSQATVPSQPSFNGPFTIYNNNLIAINYGNDGKTSGLYQYNGSKWSLLAPYSFAQYSQVTALAVYNGNLVMAGGFDNSSIKMWNGSSWLDIGTSKDFNNPINALIEYNGNLVAAGVFDTTQKGVANKIAWWNGSNWTPMADSGLQVWSQGIFALAVYNGNLVMGGNFYFYGKSDTIEQIASFNGSNWSKIGNNIIPGGIMTLSTYNGNLIAGGGFKTLLGIDSAVCIAQWNGSAWTAIGNERIGAGAYNQGPTVLTLTEYNNKLIAGGSFFSIGNASAYGLIEFDGTNWSSPFGNIVDYYLSESVPGEPEMVPGPDVISSSITFNGNLIIAGTFNSINNVSIYGVAQWNGSTWSAL